MLNDINQRAYQALMNGDTQQAAVLCQSALRKSNNDPNLHHLLGIALYQLNQYVQAASHIEKAISINAAAPDYYNNLGLVYQASGQLNQANSAFLSCLELSSTHQCARYNLARNYQLSECYQKAISIYQTLTDYHDEAKLHNNIGLCFKELGKYDRAINHLEKAVTAKPTCGEYSWNLSTAYWLTGDLEKAYHHFERRWEQDEYHIPYDFPCIEWQGEALSGKSIFIWGEQGIGDEIMFCQYLPQIVSEAAQVTVECDSRLVSIYERSFTGPLTVIPRDYNKTKAHLQSNIYDFHSSIGNLSKKPLLESSSKGAHVYLYHDRDRAARFEKEIIALSASASNAMRPLVVGLSWHSGNSVTGKSRSIPLYAFAELLSIKDVCFVNLQHGPVAGEAHEALSGHHIIRPNFNPLLSIEDTLSVIACCDLVITIDNSVAHMGGSLGKPTWLLLPFVPDWRWTAVSDTCYWYQSVEYYRQIEKGDWSTIFHPIYQRLTAICYNSKSS